MTHPLTRRNLMLSAALMGVGPHAFSQQFPRQRIRIHVGFPPGGGLDSAARIVGAHMEKVLGTSVIIENKTGASGTIAAVTVKNLPADGHELLLAETAPMEIAPLVYKNVGFDPVADFTQVGMFAVSQGTALVTTNKSGRLGSLAAFLQEAKANPGKLSYASSGAGTLHNLTMEYFCNLMGVDVLHVPFRGTGASTPAILGGETDLGIIGIQAAVPHVKSGKLTMLATAGAKRFRGMPQVPTFGEFAKAYEPCSAEFGLVAPAGVPADVLARLAAAVKAATEDAQVIEKLNGIAYDPAWIAPQEYRARVQANVRKYDRLVKLAKIERI